MYKFLLALSLLVSGITFSQDTPGTLLRRTDSLNKAIEKSIRYSDSIRNKEEIDRMTARSVDWMVNYQKQKKEKQRKQAIMYIVMGVVFLAVLIVGLIRRSKKK